MNSISLIDHKLVYCIDPTYMFKEFYSKAGWQTKEEYKEARNGCVPYNTSEDSIKMNFAKLKKMVQSGHEFRSITGCKSRSKRSFLYSYVVPVDFDDALMSLKDFIKVIEEKFPDLLPSVAYETFSNTETNFRFRFLYVFNEGLKIRKYKKYYKYIIDSLNKVCPSNHADSAFSDAVHSFLGTSKDKFYYCSNKVFFDLINIDTYDISILSSLNFMPKETLVEDINKQMLIYKMFHLSLEDFLDQEDYRKALEFNSDLYIKEQYLDSPELKALIDETCGRHALSPTEFLEKHKDQYEVIDHTFIQFGNQTMIVRPEDYYDLDWLRLHNGYGKNLRRKNGQRRKTTLGIVALYLRLIKPTISPAEMYYNLVKERLDYYNNEDFTINNHFLKSLIKSTFMLEPDEIQIRESNIDIHKPTYIIDVTRRKSIGSVEGHKPTRKLTFNPELIDWTKTCKENFIEIVKSFPNLKESTFRKYYSVHKSIQ